MGLFNNPAEAERRASLKALEDKRVAFAQALDRQGFQPEKMLFAQTDNGGFIAVCAFNGKQWLIISPGFGSDGDFVMESYDRFTVRRQEVMVKSEGMGGILGFGKKGQQGVEYLVAREDGSEVAVPFVYGRNGWGEFPLKKNPLLRTRRRSGDSNLVWDLKPIDRAEMGKILETCERYFGL